MFKASSVWSRSYSDAEGRRVNLVHCTWQGSTRTKLKEDRKQPLSLKRTEDSKYYKYRDEVCTMIYESFPNAAITCNASGSQPPIGAFEISLIFGMQELVLFSKLASKKWPNLQSLQTSLEGALGAQRVPLAMAFSRGAVRGTQRPLAHANVDIHYLEGDRLEAVHSMEQVRAHRMNESAAATASRHGAEKMAPHSSQLRTGDQGQLEITVRARGKYIVVVTVPGDEDFYCFVSADVQELAKRDNVKRSIVLPPED
jgi:hypothetical protein